MQEEWLPPHGSDGAIDKMRHEDKPLKVSRYLDMILAPGDPTPEDDLIPTGLVDDRPSAVSQLLDVDDDRLLEVWNSINTFRGIDGPGSQEPYDPSRK